MTKPTVTCDTDKIVYQIANLLHCLFQKNDISGVRQPTGCPPRPLPPPPVRWVAAGGGGGGRGRARPGIAIARGGGERWGDPPQGPGILVANIFPNTAFLFVCLFVSLLSGVYQINFRVVEAAGLNLSAFFFVPTTVHVLYPLHTLLCVSGTIKGLSCDLAKRKSSQPSSGTVSAKLKCTAGLSALW